MTQSQLKSDVYDQLAREYYDPEAHPTCAALREGSLTALERLWPSTIDPEAWIAEVGCGRTVKLDLPSRLISDFKYWVLIDGSYAMLKHSLEALQQGALAKICCATKIDLDGIRPDLLIASLGGPYNVPRFWERASDLMNPGSDILFTTPSFEWSRAFRRESGDPAEEAVFQLTSGEIIGTPSFVYDESDFQRMVLESGFELVDQTHVLREEIELASNAPKLGVLPPNGPIVSGYLFKRIGA